MIAALASALLLAAGTTGGTPLPFATVTHGSHGPAYAGEHFGEPFAQVAPNISWAEIFEKALSKDEITKLESVGYEQRFVIGVVVPERTSGYSITIKRITLQRISKAKRQFCLVADYGKPKPGQAVLQSPTYIEHTVALSAARFRIDQFHWAIPTWVLRASSGKLLAASTVGSALAHDLHKDGTPKLCRA